MELKKHTKEELKKMSEEELCDYEEKLCCAVSPGDENSINLHTLPLEFLIKIYQKITDFNEARLWTDEEVIADNINPEEIKI